MADAQDLKLRDPRFAARLCITVDTAQTPDFTGDHAIRSKTPMPAEALRDGGGSSLKSSVRPNSALFHDFLEKTRIPFSRTHFPQKSVSLRLNGNRAGHHGTDKNRPAVILAD